jgi:magnesium transporter
MLERIKSNSGPQVDQVFYRILDGLVDSYLPVLDTISESIDKMEDESLQSPEPPLLERIFDTRRTLIELRRIFANTRDVVGHLLRDETPQIRPELTPFLRDVYDHVVRGLDAVEIQRDLVTGAMELYLSSVANRTNQIMKVLTIFGTIATPALVITGMYGMNLQHLPLAERPDSWNIVIAIIAAASALMLVLLRKARWL